MTFRPATLLGTLQEFAQVAGRARRYVVAFSGGLDSTVLLDALVALREDHGNAIMAVHVDHGLHPSSADWASHCETIAGRLGVDFAICRVAVDVASAGGQEAAARSARYAALRDFVGAGDWLLSAHHGDDQAETLLLNLMRSSGPAGLAGIAPLRRFAAGWLVRPMLNVSRAELEAYAVARELDYVEDPSNAETRFDRNYLRLEILPRLEVRWPDAAGRIRRSAELVREAAILLGELAADDCSRLGDRPDRLSIPRLMELSEPRRRNALRYAIAEAGLAVPGAARLDSILTDLVAARDDAQPLVAWPGAEVRRYRDRVYLLRAPGAGGPGAQAVAGDRVSLDFGLGTLVLERHDGPGLADAVIERGIEVRYRIGGEEIRPYGQQHTKKLKKLLQEFGVVPWMRERLPMLYSGGRLVAVADLWLAADAVNDPGTAVRWENGPPIT